MAVSPELKVVFEHATESLKLTLYSDAEEMKLFVVIVRLGAEFLTEEVIWEILKTKTSVDMIDPDIVREALKIANAGEKEPAPRRIAKGKPPEQGVDGKLLLLAKAVTEKQDQEHDEKKGMYELHLFDNIEPDRIVGRIYPPKPGVDGINVFGKKLPSSQGKPVQVTIDDTIKKEAGESYEILKAKIPGYLEKKGNNLSVKEEFVVRGDIDFHTGNIDFINKVHVQGNVGSGFRVRGKQGIRVNGSVQSGSTIQGGDGPAIIGGYLVGSRVEAKGEISLTNIQQGDIETESWVELAKQSIDSTIRAGCGIIADRAHIFGGSILCVEGCNVGTLGNHAGITTPISLTTKSAVTSIFSSLQTQITSHEEAASLLKAHLGPFVIYPQRIERLAEPHKSKVKALAQKLQQVEKSRLALVGELKKLQDEPILETARVTINTKCHPGVIIIAGEEKFQVQDEFMGPKTIQRVEGKLVLHDPNPVQKPETGKTPEKKHGKK